MKQLEPADTQEVSGGVPEPVQDLQYTDQPDAGKVVNDIDYNPLPLHQ